MITLPQKIQCVERELAMRRRVYPRWVSEGRMPQAKADDEIALMAAVLATLKGLQPQQSRQMGLLQQSEVSA